MIANLRPPELASWQVGETANSALEIDPFASICVHLRPKLFYS